RLRLQGIEAPEQGRDHAGDARMALRPVDAGVLGRAPRVDGPAPRLWPRHPGVSNQPWAERPLVRHRPSARHRVARGAISGALSLSSDWLVTDLSWLDAIAGDTPVLVIAEGLVMYLHEKDGMALFLRITEQFPSGRSHSTLTAGQWCDWYPA